MSDQPEFSTYTRDEFIDEFVHPDDRPAAEEARQKRTLLSPEGADGQRDYGLIEPERPWPGLAARPRADNQDGRMVNEQLTEQRIDQTRQIIRQGWALLFTI
jgi:hypothetical protein